MVFHFQNLTSSYFTLYGNDKVLEAVFSNVDY